MNPLPNLKAFRHLSIGQKLFVYLIAFIIVPLLFAAWIINSKTSQVIASKTYENAFQNFMQTRFTLETTIRDIHFLSLSIFSDDTMQALIRFYSQKSYTDIERTKNLLQSRWGGFTFQSLLQTKPYIDSFSISRSGEIIYQYGSLVASEDPRYDAEAAELKGKPFWTPFYHLETITGSKQPVLSFIRAVNDLDTAKAIAVERISVNENELTRLYAGINTWPGGKIFVTDAEGSVISSPDKSLLGQPLGGEAYMQGVFSSREGMFDTKLDGRPYALFHYHLPDAGWHVVQLVPSGEIQGPIEVINLFIFLSIAACLLFGVFFSIAQNRSIVKPLKRLVGEMGKVKKGIFDVQLNIRSMDEIGRVGTTFLSMIAQTRELINTVYKSQLREREAELKALQSQISPHFLYNTLDSIRWLAVKNKDMQVAEQLEALSDLFRHALSKGGVMTTVGDELEHLRSYLAIQRNRFGDKHDFELRADPGLYEAKTLKMLLQPLVENAIFHGLERKIGQGRLTLTIKREDGKLVYVVEDDGVGMDPQPIVSSLERESSTVRVSALKNINDRIQLQFGVDYGLRIDSVPNVGTRIEVALPLLTEEEEHHEAVDRG